LFYKDTGGIVFSEYKVSKRIKYDFSNAAKMLGYALFKADQMLNAFKATRLCVAIIGNAIPCLIDTIGLGINQQAHIRLYAR
jgi:hypothetical protein